MRIRVLLTLAIILASCQSSNTALNKSTAGLAQVVPDDEAIYLAFVIRWSRGISGRLQIAQSTYPAPTLDQWNEAYCEHKPAFNAESWSEKTESMDLKRTPLNGLPAVRLMDPEVWRAHDPGEAIAQGESVDTAVSQGFGGGLLSLSNIVFNYRHERAIFTYGFTCGMLCGNGGFNMARKGDGGGKNYRETCGMWMS